MVAWAQCWAEVLLQQQLLMVYTTCHRDMHPMVVTHRDMHPMVVGTRMEFLLLGMVVTASSSIMASMANSSMASLGTESMATESSRSGSNCKCVLSDLS